MCMKIYLLTHEQEPGKATNTGSIALDYAKTVVEKIVWQRTSPDKTLVKLISNNKALLLYPKEDKLTGSIADFENLIIIDSTWQQARKIYNKSQYLKQMPHATIRSAAASRYQLRRNQIDGGLCTIECVIEALKIKGENKLAETLNIEFDKFNQSNSRG